ncbi:MAG: hypothetical protein RXP98_02370 [Thermoplasmata archaeon]|jgi:DNA-binding Lrp family transcriptional regulator
MDEMDIKILKKLQEGFPISLDPYLDLSKELNIQRDILINKIFYLKDRGYLKKITPILGEKYFSNTKRALIGISVEGESIGRIAEILKGYNEITHIYQRDNEYNIWFTFVSKREDRIEKFKEEFLKRNEIKKFVILFSEELYKLDVNFKVNENGTH